MYLLDMLDMFKCLSCLMLVLSTVDLFTSKSLLACFAACDHSWFYLFCNKDLMIHLSQKIYIKQLLEQFSMQNCSLASILMQHDLQILDQSFKKYIKFIINDYQLLIENLQFLAIYIHLNIAFTMSFLT